MRGASLYERNDDGIVKFNNSVTDDEVIFRSGNEIMDGYVDKYIQILQSEDCFQINAR